MHHPAKIMKQSSIGSNLTNRMCDTNPKAILHTLNTQSKYWKIQKSCLWGVKTACPCWLGQGASFILSGIRVVLQQVKRADTIHTHMHAIVFQLSGSMLIAFHNEQQSGSFVCIHTQSKREHKWCLWGKYVWNVCLISSIGRLHEMLLTQIFGNMFAFFPVSCLHKDTTGLFLGAQESCTHSISTSLQTWEWD